MNSHSGHTSSGFDTAAQLVASAIAVPLLIVLMVLVNLLQAIYAIDLIAAGWILAVIFLGPMLLTVIWSAVALCFAPLGLAVSEEAPAGARMLALALVPVALGAGFMLWQIQNSLIYGVIDAEPTAYNWIFERIGLGI